MKDIKTDYYYGKDAEQFIFYRIPKLLVKDEAFRDLSLDAKLLYGLLLDRMSLSLRNGWTDEENRVFIIYTFNEIMEDLGCAEQKAAKLLGELSDFGLVERKRRGLGRPNIIYVKSFNSQTDDDSTAVKITEPDLRKSQFKNCENHNSEAVKITEQELRKSQTNNTEYNNTDYSDTEYNNNYTSENEEYCINPIISEHSVKKDKTDAIDAIEEHNRCIERIKENIDFERLALNYGSTSAEGIAELMCDVICSKKPYISVNRTEVPAEVVRSRLLKLGNEHIEYVLDCLKRNTTKVRNIKSYLISSLYNSYTTIEQYYTAEVNHDMYASAVAQ